MYAIRYLAKCSTHVKYELLVLHVVPLIRKQFNWVFFNLNSLMTVQRNLESLTNLDLHCSAFRSMSCIHCLSTGNWLNLKVEALWFGLILSSNFVIWYFCTSAVAMWPMITAPKDILFIWKKWQDITITWRGWFVPYLSDSEVSEWFHSFGTSTSQVSHVGLNYVSQNLPLSDYIVDFLKTRSQ